MNPKTVVLIAIGFGLITLSIAPYHFVGHFNIVDPQRVSGTIHRPVWDPPKRMDIEYLPVGVAG
jgi:hypothetical protein